MSSALLQALQLSLQKNKKIQNIKANTETNYGIIL